MVIQCYLFILETKINDKKKLKVMKVKRIFFRRII